MPTDLVMIAGGRIVDQHTRTAQSEALFAGPNCTLPKLLEPIASNGLVMTADADGTRRVNVYLNQPKFV